MIANEEQEALAYYLDEEYADSIIRQWDDGSVEMYWENASKAGFSLQPDDLPGNWCVKEIDYYGEGVKLTFVLKED